MSPGRRSVYCSLGLIFVLSHLTAAYSVEEICSRRCLYHRGGVLCNCNARHFTGKRSGQATDASMLTARSARRGQPAHSTNNHFHDLLVPDSDGTLGIHLVTSQELQQNIRDLWGRHRLGPLRQDVEQQAGDAVDSETEDEFKNGMADRHIDELPEVMLQQEVGEDDIDDVNTLGVGDHYAVVGGNDDDVLTRVASHRHLRQLEAALGRAVQGRRRSRLD